jgi:hypothetical protein
MSWEVLWLLLQLAGHIWDLFTLMQGNASTDETVPPIPLPIPRRSWWLPESPGGSLTGG